MTATNASVLAPQPACGGAATLPERDPARPNSEQGLFRKFDVRRTDGTDTPGGKHHDCDYYVLDVTHDPHAKPALEAYAAAVEATHPDLARDMRDRYGLAQAQGGEDSTFAEWLASEMPAGTVIGDPAWWADRIARQYAKRSAPPSAPVATARWALVPGRMQLTPENVEVLVNMLVIDDEATDPEARWAGGVLWVGETTGDDGEKFYGLNVANVEYLEEGSVPVVEFASPPPPSEPVGVEVAVARIGFNEYPRWWAGLKDGQRKLFGREPARWAEEAFKAGARAALAQPPAVCGTCKGTKRACYEGYGWCTCEGCTAPPMMQSAAADEAAIELAWRAATAACCDPSQNHKYTAPVTPEDWSRALRAAVTALAQHAGFDFAAHLQRQREWSGRTFGPGPRTAGVIDHIRKELIEIEAAPHDGEEWIDVAILALDGAWRAGLTPQQIINALVAKQTKNEGRTWPDWRTADPNKAIEHDRSGESPPAAGEAVVRRLEGLARRWDESATNDTKAERRSARRKCAADLRALAKALAAPAETTENGHD